MLQPRSFKLLIYNQNSVDKSLEMDSHFWYINSFEASHFLVTIGFISTGFFIPYGEKPIRDCGLSQQTCFRGGDCSTAQSRHTRLSFSPFSKSTSTSFTQSDCTAPFVSTAQSPRIQPCTSDRQRLKLTTYITAKVSNELSLHCFHHI